MSKFFFRFCNAYNDNEKGHVQRTIEAARRKAFSQRNTFKFLTEANIHLVKVLNEFNSNPISGKIKSAKEFHEEEREYFMHEMSIYETAIIEGYRVSKYSNYSGRFMLLFSIRFLC